MSKKTTTGPTNDQLVEVATSGLAGIARPGEVGAFLAPEESDGVWTVRAEATQPGYPGWFWTVTVTAGDGDTLTVTEVNLLPGDGALLSPEWVPWSERLDEYRRVEAQKELDADAADGDDDDDHDDHDDDDLDDVLDGIDIDQLDLDLDPSGLEVPDEPNDVFDHVDLDDEDD